ncbi:CTP:phosphocholine cytidylyltransferase-like protein [Bradyrhizobium sp. i1.4.4]
MSDRPNRAIILASGAARACVPMTETPLEPLTDVHDTPILHNSLDNLAGFGGA